MQQLDDIKSPARPPRRTYNRKAPLAEHEQEVLAVGAEGPLIRIE